MSVALDAVLARLHGVRRSGNRYMACCPAHEDQTPSLSINEREGKILVHCHAGCSQEAVLAAMKIELRELFSDNGAAPRIVAEYDYQDENGKLLFQVVRYEPKDFRQRRPGGKGGWIWNLNGVRRVLYNLPAVLKAENVLIVEGEKDVETARDKYGLVATCNPMGAGKWRDEDSDFLAGKNATIIGDNDNAGHGHAEQVAKSCYGKTKSLAIAHLPEGIKDLSHYAQLGFSRASLLQILDQAPPWKPSNSKSATRDGCNPWSRAEGMPVFLKGEEELVDYLHFPVIVRGAVTNMFSPRGAGKSIWTLGAAVELALKGIKVLLIDRDNPRREVKARLRSFGATSDLPFLKVISREHAPPLTDARAWGEFPYAEYDLVIVDSLDSAAEGVGEQDSAKPSKAIAPLLDIAHRENGPAVLVLGNCVRTGAHSRGSGVIEDRADIVFEVRDCTNFRPTGQKPWWEELPAADAASWASRSSRRKKQVKFRLAFISTKFRVGEEPEPFIVELNLADEPWTVRNVTDEVDLEGKAERERLERVAAERTEHARTALVEEINRRRKALEPPLWKDRDAIPLLQKNGLTQKQSRQLIKDGDGSQWRLVRLAGAPGKPVAVLPLGYDFVANSGYIKVSDDGNTTPQDPAKNGPFESTYFRWPLEMQTTEIGCEQPIETTNVTPDPLSVADPNYKGVVELNRPPRKSYERC